MTDWEDDATRGAARSDTPDPAHALVRASAVAAWRAAGAAIIAFAALDRLMDATILPAHQSLWRVLAFAAVAAGAATFYRFSVSGAARSSRLLAWFTAAGYCGFFAILELSLSAIGASVHASADALTWWRLGLVATTVCATAALFNRIAGRLLRESAAERAALERTHADALRLEGVLLAARTMQHRINNSLAIVTAYADQLAHDSSLPVAARGKALVALEAGQAAARHLADLGRVTRVEQEESLGVPLLDLERSIAREAADASPNEERVAR